MVFTSFLRDNGVDVQEFIRRAIEDGSLATCINPEYWVSQAFAFNIAKKEGFRPRHFTWAELSQKWNQTIQQLCSIAFDNDSPKWNREILERKYLKGKQEKKQSEREEDRACAWWAGSRENRASRCQKCKLVQNEVDGTMYLNPWEAVTRKMNNELCSDVLSESTVEKKSIQDRSVKVFHGKWNKGVTYKKLVFTEWLRKNGVDVQEFIRRATDEDILSDSTLPSRWVSQAFNLIKAKKDGFNPKNTTWGVLFGDWEQAIRFSGVIKFDEDCYGWNKEILEEKYLKQKQKQSVPDRSVKVFHGKRKTVLIHNGKKAVSKCQKGDRYSRLAGLASAAMKLAGFTYEEIALALDESKKNAYKSGQE